MKKTPPMQVISLEQALSSRRSSYLRFISLGVSATLIVIGAAMLYRWVNAADILDKLRQLDWRWFVPALFAYWVQYPIGALRLHCVMHWLMRPGLPPVPRWRLLLKLTLSSGFIGVTAPIGMMADAAKIGALKYFGRIPISQAVRATFFDRVAAAQWLALFALATLPIQWMNGLPRSSIVVEFLVAGGFVVAIVALLILPRVFQTFHHHIMQKVAYVFSGYEAMFWPDRVAIQIAIAALNLLLVFIGFYCMAGALQIVPHLIAIACLIPFLQLVNSIPFLYLGWGGREIAMAMIVGPASGLAIDQALAISAVWGLTMMLAGAANGVFLIGDWQSFRTARI
jgi:hypothetical protein